MCVVGVPDSYRGSSQAGGARFRAHVRSGAWWGLFHLTRCPNARWLWVRLHRQVNTIAKNVLKTEVVFNGVNAQRLWYGVYVASVDRWDCASTCMSHRNLPETPIMHEGSWLSSSTPPDPFLVFHPHLSFCFSLPVNITLFPATAAIFHFNLVNFLLSTINKSLIHPHTSPLLCLFFYPAPLGVSRVWHFRGAQGEGVASWRSGQQEGGGLQGGLEKRVDREKA